MGFVCSFYVALGVRFSSVQLLSHVWLFVAQGTQHARPPCPSSTPRVYSNSCALSQWCHPAISSSVVPFSSYLQSFPASASFAMSQFFTSGTIWSNVGAPKIKSATASTASPSICHEVMGPDAMIFVSECRALSQLFHSPLSLSSRGIWVLLHFLP